MDCKIINVDYNEICIPFGDCEAEENDTTFFKVNFQNLQSKKSQTNMTRKTNNTS
jgi:hypothetical protein